MAPSLRNIRHYLSAQGAFYLLIFACLGVSTGLLLLHVLGESQLWNMVYRLYLYAALGYTWYVFTLLFISDIQKRSYKKYNNDKFAVIIPCYNEDPKLLRRTVLSVLKAKGNKLVTVVDDGSTNGVHRELKKLGEKYDINIHFFERNKGKRSALHYAVKKLIARCKYIVTIDSDTIVDEDAFVRLIEPLKDKKIGAASGDIRVLNEDENVLTKMVGAYYWSALHIHRKAQSAFGMVSCCSGALAAYKSTIIKKIIDDFVTQEFFGSPCTYSEDRHLTNQVLKQGYDVVFVPEAVAHTNTPSTMRSFLKQQQRWRRGFIKEGLYALTFTWKTKPLLFLEILFWEMMIPFLAFGIMVTFTVAAVTNPMFLLLGIIPSLAVIMLVKHIPAFFHARDKLAGLFLFAVFASFVSYWQGIYALLTVKRTGWNTR